jgi:hypothetical protein
MAFQGKTQLIYVIVAPPDQAKEGERLFASHAPWMKATHHRDGDKALLTYNVSKAPELSNPMDQNSAPTGTTVFVLSEIYQSVAGVTDHVAQAASGLQDFPALV